MVERALQYGRYGYRRVAAMLRDAGWHLNDKRVERLWRHEGLKVPMQQPMRSRLWLNDGSCTHLWPQHVDHFKSYDFVHHRIEDGRAYRTLNIIDELSRECLVFRVKRKLNSTDVIDALTDLFIFRGVPNYIRLDNGPEFIAEAVRQWIKAVGRGDCVYRAEVTLGERLLRELQRPFQGRTLKRGNILYPVRRANRDRAVATTLQDKTAAFSHRIQTTRVRKRHPHGGKANHARNF